MMTINHDLEDGSGSNSADIAQLIEPEPVCDRLGNLRSSAHRITEDDQDQGSGKQEQDAANDCRPEEGFHDLS
jgi:hypothetical protein